MCILYTRLKAGRVINTSSPSGRIIATKVIKGPQYCYNIQSQCCVGAAAAEYCYKYIRNEVLLYGNLQPQF